MGEVYRAEDTRLNRPVAIKFLSSEIADESARRRFQQEAKMASALNHPHILTVHEADEVGGRQYLVTEFIDGGTLRDWARGVRSWRQVVELLIGVADAIATAHQAGILHRDIKPENILITSSGYAKLADFGLAKLDKRAASEAVTGTMTAQTRPGAIVGTVAYMSPEQTVGQPLDARSDVFSFGVVLYEMLAGRRPFAGASDFEVLQAIVHRSPEPLPAVLPIPLRLAVEKALEKDPADRYQSMRDMVVDLRRSLRHTQNAPAPPPIDRPRTETWKWLAAAAALALALIAGTALFLTRSQPPVESSAQVYTPLTNFADSAVAPSLSPDGRMLAFIRGESTFTGPGEVYVKILPDGEPVQLTRDGLAKMGPTVFSPDGTRIAYSVGIEETWVVPVLGGEATRLLAKAGGLTWVNSRADPRHVLFSKLLGEGLHMGLFTSTESRSDERIVYLPTDVNGMAHRSSASRDGTWVLAAEMDLGGWLPCRLVPFDGGSQGRVVGSAPAQCTDVAWSPDGRWMYFSANTGNGFHIWRQRFPDGLPEQITSGATEEQGIAFDPDGGSLVTSVGESHSTLWIHDAHGDRQITSQGYAFMPAFSEDGRSLYYLQRSQASRRFVSGELWVTDVVTGHRERLLTDFLMEHYDVARDEGHVAFVSIDDEGRSEVWRAPLDRSSPPRRLTSFDVVVRAVFDPTGGVLFVGGESGSPFLYHIDEDGGSLRKVLPNPITFLYAVSPDGSAIAVWEGNSVLVYSRDGTARTVICAGCGTAGGEDRGVTPSLVTWSFDGRFLSLYSELANQTFAIPLRRGQLLPSLPPSGLPSLEAAVQLPGTLVIPQQRAFVSTDPSLYAFPRL